MMSQQRQAAIEIHDHVQPAKLRLVGDGIGNISGREAVERKSGYPDLFELPAEHIDALIEAARSGDENHQWSWSRGTNQTQDPGNSGRLASALAGQELLVRNRNQLDRHDLDA